MITRASIMFGGSYKKHLAVNVNGKWRTLCGTSCAMKATKVLDRVTCKRCLAMAAKQTQAA